jgi:hypothetical protein
MHKLRTEPRAYEYKIPMPAEMTIGRMPEHESAGIGLFAVALLGSLIGLPELPESGSEGGGKRETPQSSLIGKS